MLARAGRAAKVLARAISSVMCSGERMRYAILLWEEHWDKII